MWVTIAKTLLTVIVLLHHSSAMAQPSEDTLVPHPDIIDPKATVDRTEPPSGADVEEDERLEEGTAADELSRQFHLDEPGLGGVLVDRTITMVGKTFYQQFSQLRLDSAILSNVSLSIHERPSARWGSQIWIAENNRILFQATLPPLMSDIDDYAKAAVAQVEDMVIQRTIQRALGSDPDLADEEI